VHAVGEHDAVSQDGRCVVGEIARLVVISTVGCPIGGAATGIVGAPTPADIDAVIGGGGDVVVHDHRRRGVGDQHGRLLAIILRHILDDVVANEDVANTHLRP